MSLVLAVLALLLPGTAHAHHGERHPPPNQVAQADSIRELQRQRANPEVPPGVQAQRRDAADADALEAAGAAEQLRAAATAIRAGRLGQANELLERAESRLLTRSTVPVRAGEPVTAGPVGHIAAARRALLARDTAQALGRIEAAQAELGPAGRRARPAR
jgi:hypothetical protein